MKEIRGDAKNIRQLLSNQVFNIDYFQREYRWGKKHVEELIDDLAQEFIDNYIEGSLRSDVRNYDLYFLGSIVTSNKDNQRSIVDGQQRLTTLTLLLIFLYHKVDVPAEKAMIAPLISSYKFGQNSYNLNISTRNSCMNHLYNRTPLYQSATDNPSVTNMIARYEDIESAFPEEILQTEALGYFIDWLLERVYLVETTADDEAGSYTIFETMNDRGLSLTPTEMLRGYLLAQIDEEPMQRHALATWDDRTRDLRRIGKEEDADAIKNWLRGQHAQSIRQGRQGALPEDFDLIGTEFHRWVRDRESGLGLTHGEAVHRFITQDFDFYARWYGILRDASNTMTDGLEPLFYVARSNFTLQYMPALASLCLGDEEDVCIRKLGAVATAIDCILNRRVWNNRSNSHSTMRVFMFQAVTLQARRKTLDQLTEFLCNLVDGYSEQFAPSDFSLHGMNRPKIHQMLARMTDFVDAKSERPSLYQDYLKRWGSGYYQIEHVLSESHREGFDNFDYHRNKIGALVLLPGKDNASFGDLRYEEKRMLYPQRNLLAGSLDENAYHNNPGFKRFMSETGLPFRPYEVFDVDAINERQELYRQLAEHIWSTDSIRRVAEA